MIKNTDFIMHLNKMNKVSFGRGNTRGKQKHKGVGEKEQR